MRTSTRLLLPLISTLVITMLAVGVWLLNARERALLAQARRETQAYATALAIALENASAEAYAEIHPILERVSREPKIYGLLVYDARGQVVDAAAPLRTADARPAAEVRAVIDRRTVRTHERRIGNEGFLSVLRPLRSSNGGISGALEVVQPFSTVQAEISRTRQRHLFSGLVLLLAVIFTIRWLVNRIIGSPLREIAAATRALGSGELTFRIGRISSGAELQQLSQEFNQMADRLESARLEVLREGEERIVLERRLQQHEKLAALGNLAAIVAHEIAAPLNVVAGRAEMLTKPELPAEKRERNLQIIQNQIGRITIIVRNLLDFARRREPRMRRVDVVAVISGVVEFLEDDLQRAEVELRTDFGNELFVEGDADLLHQVFLNILLNAMQALEHRDDGACIEISARRDDGASNPAVIIEFGDNGPGIPADIADHVFEPFFTTKPGRAGTGLGLAVARSIVEEHGGTIEVARSEGARFVIRIPAIGTAA